MSDRVLILFGAGNYGKNALNNVNKELYRKIFFCDNEKSKCGKTLGGIRIISFEEFKRLFETENVEIIITCNDYYSINKQLIENNLIENPEKTKVWNRKRIVDIEHLNMQRAYSQQGEDIFLRSFFADRCKKGARGGGVCVDVGAHDPFRFSNTYWSYQWGWKCINIEPNPETFERFNIYRKKDININVGISDVERDIQYYMFEEPAYNTFDTEFADRYMIQSRLIRKVNVPCRRLDTILEEYGIEDIDYFNIDVENYEMQVLNSNDWERFRPELILIEQFVNRMDEIESSEICRFLKAQQYECKNVIGDTVIYIRGN